MERTQSYAQKQSALSKLPLTFTFSFPELIMFILRRAPPGAIQQTGLNERHNRRASGQLAAVQAVRDEPR